MRTALLATLISISFSTLALAQDEVPIEDYQPVEDPFVDQQTEVNTQVNVTVTAQQGQGAQPAPPQQVVVQPQPQGYQLQQPYQQPQPDMARLELDNTLRANRLGGAITMLGVGIVGTLGFGFAAGQCYELFADDFSCQWRTANTIFAGLPLLRRAWPLAAASCCSCA